MGKKERLAKFVKDLRGDRSQAWLAKKLNVSTSSVNFWEAGLAQPSAPNFKKLAILSKYSLKELLEHIEKGVPLKAPSPEVPLHTVPIDSLLEEVRSRPFEEVAMVAKVALETMTVRRNKELALKASDLPFSSSDKTAIECHSS